MKKKKWNKPTTTKLDIKLGTMGGPPGAVDAESGLIPGGGS